MTRQTKRFDRRMSRLVPALVVSFTALSAISALRADPPANDDFADAEVISGPFGEASGTSRDATRQALEPNHAGVSGGRSVWWKWTSPVTGGATFDTVGSGFDTVIAIYRGSALNIIVNIAANDDISLSRGIYQSRVSFEVTEDADYYIAVDGWNGDSGSIRLHWSTIPGQGCVDPATPSRENPPHESEDVPTEVTLSWNQEPVQFLRKVIYGQDDRRDVYQVTDGRLLDAYDSTVAVLSRGDLRPNGDGSYSLPTTTFGESYGLCAGEPYADQPNPAWCSGFLVAPDIVATAGHCIEVDQDCSGVAFVFGFQMLDADTPVLDIDASQVYFCDGIVAGIVDDGGADWALVRVDRPVVDHEPLPIRRQGKIEDGAPVVVIGHPSGLPAKIAGGANVRDNGPWSFFTANLDTYGGNSGSAVFNMDSMEVEGILVRGAPDFVDNGTCISSARCPNDGCRGEDVTRITMLDQFVPGDPPDETYDVLFGECGNLVPLARIPETTFTVSDLEPDTVYCWQIVVRSECGTTAGPVWSFTTSGGSGGSSFIRGDATQDLAVNLTDAVRILNYLFLSGQAPQCLDSADTDDGGTINLTDAVYLLNYLFLAGSPLPAPSGSCGDDASPDDLDCQEFAGCP